MLILVKGNHCPLCDDAEAVLAEAGVTGYDCRYVEDDRALRQAYGLRIPVLLDSQQQRELPWPFDATGLRRWLTEGADAAG